MDKIAKIQEKARKIRRYSLEMITAARSGHPGGSLSSADIMAVLYFYKLKHDPKNPCWNKRDRFVLSKGHCCPALYAALALAGYFPEKELMTLRKLGSRLQGHPELGKLPGVEASTGPLGQGLSFANGIALAAKLDKLDHKVYVLLGDGELQEGQVWEAMMTSSHYKLDNLIAIIDKNNLQIDGHTQNVKNIDPLDKKFEAFNWNVITIDGHDIKAIMDALDKASKAKAKPTVIIANTIKGKGVVCMEDKAEWHGKACSPVELEEALDDLGGTDD